MSKATIYVSGIDIENDAESFATKHAEDLAAPTTDLVAKVIRKGFRGVLAGVIEVHQLDRARIAVLERHIDCLRAALKPFAEDGAGIDRGWSPDRSRARLSDRPNYTVGQFFAAHDAYSKEIPR